MKREVNLDDVALAKQGDRAATARVLADMEGLCRWYAKKRYRGALQRVTFGEVVQECRYATLRALKPFKPDAGTKFATYALMWMRAKVNVLISRERAGPAVYISRKNGSITWAPTSSLDTFYKHDPSNSDDRRLDIADPSVDVHADAEERSFELLMSNAIDKLPEREREILRRHAGGETLATIGLDYGLTRERIRQLEVRARDRLRKVVAANGWSDAA